MSESENKNLVGLDSLNNYLKGSQPVETPKSSPLSLSSTYGENSSQKTTQSVLEEMNAKIKMLEVGGQVAEKLLSAGNQIVDKIIKAKQMQYMAEQQQAQPQPSPAPQQIQQAPSPAQIDPNMVYDGFVQILEFFLNIDKDLKVCDLLDECKEKKELALSMIDKFMKQQQAQAQQTANVPPHVAESMQVMKKEERLQNAS